MKPYSVTNHRMLTLKEWVKPTDLTKTHLQEMSRRATLFY